MTECNTSPLEFQPLGRREVVAEFTGETITSDAGALLLREIDQRLGVIESLAECFEDFRDPDLIEHPLEQLLAQPQVRRGVRVFGIALGYEDINDHDQLRHDPLLAVARHGAPSACGHPDPTGSRRIRPEDRGKALAGRNTLNRLELTPPGASAASRYKKIVARHGKLENFFVEMFLRQHASPPKEIVLDVDATDDPLHGSQHGRFTPRRT